MLTGEGAGRRRPPTVSLQKPFMLQADPPLQTVTVRMEPEEEFPGALRVDLNTTRYTVQNAEGVLKLQAAEFSADGVLDWMRTCGIEGNEQRLSAEAESVARRILGAPQFGLDATRLYTGGLYSASGGGVGPDYNPDSPRVFRSTQGFRRNEYEPVPWLKAARVCFWILLWLAVVIYFLRRRERSTGVLHQTVFKTDGSE